jgi:hypothetical protein
MSMIRSRDGFSASAEDRSTLSGSQNRSIVQVGWGVLSRQSRIR